MKKNKHQARQRLAIAALEILTDKDWDQLTIDDIFSRAGPGEHVKDKILVNKKDVLNLIGEWVSQEMIQNAEGISGDLLERDRLFDVLMARIEALQKYRGAFLKLIETSLRNPRALLDHAFVILGEMDWVLMVARLEGSDFQNHLRKKIIAFVYFKTLRVWKEDKSLDLSKTMAELDRNIRLYDITISMKAA